MDPSTTYAANPMKDTYLLELLEVRRLIHLRFAVKTLHVSGEAIRFEAESLRAPWREIQTEVRGLGYNAYKTQWGRRIIVTFARTRNQRTLDEKRELRTAWILFFATICTTLFIGYFSMLFNKMDTVEAIFLTLTRKTFSMAHLTNALTLHAGERIVNALVFSSGLLFILGTHEMGHKLAAMRNGINASPPKFIPLPVGLGTLGAFIRLRSPMPDENAAVEMGISGPVAGFIAALPILFLGLLTAQHVPTASLSQDMGIIFWDPPILKIFAHWVIGIPRDHTIFINPLMFAGWVGLLVTMLNLMPIGQFDGGHIARAMLGAKGHLLLSRVLVAGLVGLGIFTGYFGWYIWAAIAAFFLRFPYPPHAGAIAPLRSRNILIAVIGLVIFFLCFMPMPVS